MLRKGSIETKNRILSVCVRLFLEQGYHQTPISQIIREAQVSASTFQNIFRTKDGILGELVEFMFGGQFNVARSVTRSDLPAVYVYAAETAIQLVLTEQNENLRDIYLEAYNTPQTSDFIYQHMAQELFQIFGPYQPMATQSDFYEFEIGTAGIMRGYMAKPCDIHFPLEKKLDRFLTLSLRSYRVPEEVQKRVLAYIRSIDILKLAENVVQQLFAALEMRFDFSLNQPPKM